MADGQRGTADRWLALLAGRNTWHDEEVGIDPISRTVSLVEALSLVAGTAAVAVTASFQSPLERVWLSTPALVLIATTVLAVVGPVSTVAGRTWRSRSATVNALVRSSLGILMCASIFALLPSWWAMTSWTIGVAIGADTALTSTTMGWRPTPLEWWLSVVVSPLHLGVVGGLVGAVLAVGTSAAQVIAPMYATFHLWLIVATITAWAHRTLLHQQNALLDQTRHDTVRDEHRRSAHWLHDDICAQLRLVTLKLQQGQLGIEEVGVLLDELDFALRLRQLDELIESGSVRLAEVLQPFLRNAQNYGAVVERVPSYEVASTEVGHDTALLFRRTAAVLTSNALNAGATRLSFDVDVSDGRIQLSVSDDAGGFDLADITAGRGLWSLRHDLGPDHLTIAPLDGGSCVTAVIRHRMESPWHN